MHNCLIILRGAMAFNIKRVVLNLRKREMIVAK